MSIARVGDSEWLHCREVHGDKAVNPCTPEDCGCRLTAPAGRMGAAPYAAFQTWLRCFAARDLRAAYGSTENFLIEAVLPTVNDFRLLRVMARIAFAAGWAASRSKKRKA